MPRQNDLKNTKTAANPKGATKPVKVPIRNVATLLQSIGAFLAVVLGAVGSFLLILYQVGVFSKPTPTPTPALPVLIASVASLAPIETLTSSPTLEIVTSVTPLPTATALICPWIPFLNGDTVPALSGEKCLNDLKGNGILGNEKRISFFVDKSPLGMYGVCQDISEREKIEFHVDIQNNIDSARFLVTIGPEPVPNKSSYAMRIQPEIQPKKEKEMYVKFIQYTLAGYDKDIDKIKAIPDWKHLNNWGFDFVFQFSGSKVTASMNQALLETWQLAPSNRYLCFVYQAMPTTTHSAQLEAQVQFP